MLRTPKMYPPKLGGIGPSIVKFWTTHTLSKERFFCHKIHEDECDRSEYNISRGENMKALQHWGCHNVSEIWVTAATLSSFLQFMLLSEDLMMIFSFDLMCSVCPFSYKWCSKMPKNRCDQFLHQAWLRARNTALITSMMLNNLELLTSETQNQRSACNVLRNLHFLSFSPLANTESWERFFFWTDLLHPPASLHWQRGAEFDFKSTYGQQGHWKDGLGLKESSTSRKYPKTSDKALSFCREYLPAGW